jgi:DMSO reductase family type II enzyme chaperone
MSEATVTVVREDPFRAALEAPSRGEVYALLALAFSFPDADLHARAREGQLAEQLTAALGWLPFRLRTSDLRWPAPRSHEDMQSEYIRLFQIGGRRGPPCSLHEGFYTRDRSQTLQTLIRFYNYFGFRVVECVMPDHLPVQLEFMSELAAGDVADDLSRLRAQRDFLSAHLAWADDLAGHVAGARPHAFYRSLTTLLSRLIAADRQFIRSALGDHYNGRT